MRVLSLHHVLNLCLALAPSAIAYRTGAMIRIRKNLSHTSLSMSGNSNIDETDNGNPDLFGSAGDDRAINDIISRGFLPSGPEDLANFGTGITEVTNSPEKR